MRLLLSGLFLLLSLPVYAKTMTLRVTGYHPNGRTTCKAKYCDTGPRTATGKRCRAGDVAGPRWMLGKTITILSVKGGRVPRTFIGRRLKVVDVCGGGLDLAQENHPKAKAVGRGVATFRLERR